LPFFYPQTINKFTVDFFRQATQFSGGFPHL
jgi:hypothetical protein